MFTIFTCFFLATLHFHKRELEINELLKKKQHMMFFFTQQHNMAKKNRFNFIAWHKSFPKLAQSELGSRVDKKIFISLSPPLRNGQALIIYLLFIIVQTALFLILSFYIFSHYLCIFFSRLIAGVCAVFWTLAGSLGNGTVHLIFQCRAWVCGVFDSDSELIRSTKVEGKKEQK